MSDNRTFFLFVVDRSGSMGTPAGFREEMELGINNFLKDQREVPGKCRVTLAQFDTVYEEVFSNVKLAETPNVVITPRGGTALLDSVGKAITDLRAHFKSLPKGKRPDKVLVTIITDGGENSSREWKKDKLQALVAECIKDGWEFSYLGANQDAFSEAATMGIPTASTLQYTTATAGAMTNVHSTATSDWRTRTLDSLQYSGAQRKTADPSYVPKSNRKSK